MSTGSALCLSTCQSPRQAHHRMNLGSLKRRARHYLDLPGRGEASYPSPPMSNPPSPLEHSQDERTPLVTTLGEQSIATSASSTSTSMPGIAISAPTHATSFLHASNLPGQSSSPSAAAPLSTSTQPSLQRPHATSSTSALPFAQSSLSLARPTSSRGGRKSKAHVASACINCKKAHLSCDVNRPCARCVASGKQDTCYDVQHKKRGRPRLREEGEFKVEQMLPEAGPSTSIASSADLTARPIASTKHRRHESFRSLRSQGSDGSGVASSPNYAYPPPPTATQATFGFQNPYAPSFGAPTYEVPTAYLDLDLVFLKANAPFRQIILAGQEVVGRSLSDVAAPVDGETFQNICNHLRTERDARDPAYMPPINLPGQDPLQGATVEDIERYTRGFEDHTYTWTHTQLGVAAQRFPARVRLAKAHTYWIAITLPSFHPVEHMIAHPSSFPPLQPLAPGLQSQPPDSYTSRRREPARSNPVAGFMPMPGSAVALQRPPRIADQHTAPPRYHDPQSQPLYQPQQAYPSQPPGAAPMPRLPVAEPPTETTAFTPRTTARELPIPHATSGRTIVQLPPLMSTPGQNPTISAGGATSARPRELISQPVESDEGEETNGQGRTRKRRRMGINDVLH
ncbi:hypothetical protein CLAFUW4_12239 [Fulvia fulva]|uniref:Zn(2)-C6 fungal-type domain-containing protein n=1 Tax=Passalora fulva TaxID=5499 RepID=A0A9Q8PED2_PASFU|nr:uncharacterized protein CLAFUR5_11269 [Fulvia fulva]KAK4617509.1 hypothetical protein CLAFUR4_12244 [Fulvia fulva]KAK4618632.1 hypothetical protein CLAFUR0_12255 [Fulvia fulva]UJO20881.1 hypothetical protein CLAFUR5_11269 [Fulvia fulva]WPV18614.1 hypothetical protein CLAFUW4_12239 [Fulvia fulva]WPV33060.1 hypothetical protein CLAFUW7_12246 [Fulvia fulva]